MAKGTRPSLKEIAENLGVSQATVSFVLHNKDGVGSETRTKVVAELKKHGYIFEDGLAVNKAIHLVKYTPIGFSVDGKGEYSSHIVDTVVLNARNRGCDISITTCHEGELLKTIDFLCANPLDGMILLGSDLPLIYSDYFDNYSKPLVLVGTSMPTCNRDSVVIDNYACMYNCIYTLYNQGHRNFCYIRSCFKTYNTVERSCAFNRIVDELKISSECSIMQIDASERLVYDNLVSILNTRSFPTAIIADSEVIALGMIQAMRRFGYDVPDTASIICIGDGYPCQLFDPPITCVKIPEDQIGKAAIKRLFELMDTAESSTVRCSIGSKLIVRSSTQKLEH